MFQFLEVTKKKITSQTLLWKFASILLLFHRRIWKKKKHNNIKSWYHIACFCCVHQFWLFMQQKMKMMQKFDQFSFWTYLLMISGPLMTVMWAPTSLAMALPIIVFPVPGGPYRRTPRGGGIPVESSVRLVILKLQKHKCHLRLKIMISKIFISI